MATAARASIKTVTATPSQGTSTHRAFYAYAPL
jgi:hypothetical protein